MYENFQVPGVSFEPLGQGLVRCTVANANGRASFTPHGAHFLSFAPAGAEEVLWLSGESWYEPGKPIRGGIPVCWPYFGGAADGGPAHGYARIAEWKIDAIVPESSGDTCVILSLPAGQLPEKYAFLTARLVAHIGKNLRLELTTCNKGAAPYRLTEALHSYFSVGDAAGIAVEGLDAVSYLDKVEDRQGLQVGKIVIDREVDRVYTGTGSACVIDDPAYARRIRIRKEGSASTVVWNPWIAKSIRMPDFGNEEYRGMVCVETVNAAEDARVLQPGELHTLTTVIGLED